MIEKLKEVFKRNSEIESMFDLDLISGDSKRSYLQRMAMDTVLNYVARTMSLAEFRIKVDDQYKQRKWDYALNISPNSDDDATTFWQNVFYRLLSENEVLIIQSDDGQLLIAEDFVRNEFAVYEDTFEGVMVKNYEFKRKFKMSDVIYMEYNNDELKSFTDGLFDDYSELFGRMIEVSMRNNQIRGSVEMEVSGTLKDEKDENGLTRQDKLQKFIDKIYNTFKTSSVAIVPKMKGLSYEEYTNKQGVTNQSLDELDKMKKSLVSDIARMVGVSPALVLGEMADIESNKKATMANCFKPLIKKLEKVLIKTIIKDNGYFNGETIEVVGVDTRDIFELATAIDKLVSSGSFNRNEIRKEVDYESVEGLDEFYITKNYEAASKGGDE